MHELNLTYIVHLIDEYHESSKVLGDEGHYPNSLLVTEEQYKEIIKNMFKIMEVPEEAFDEIYSSIKFICGLKVIISNHLESPKVLRI